MFSQISNDEGVPADKSYRLIANRGIHRGMPTRQFHLDKTRLAEQRCLEILGVHNRRRLAPLCPSRKPIGKAHGQVKTIAL